MTASQIARLCYPQEKYAGKTFTVSKENKRTGKIRTNEYPASYPTATKELARMKERGLVIKHPKRFQELPHFWSLSDRMRREYKIPPIAIPKLTRTYEHDIFCVNLYVQYALTGQLQKWDTPTDPDLKKLRLRPDRRMVLSGRLFFWEVDRGTEPQATIEGKIEKYIQYSRLHPELGFNVLFSVAPYPDLNVEKRADEIRDIIIAARMGLQFLVTLQELTEKYPLGGIFSSPFDHTRFYSLAELEQ